MKNFDWVQLRKDIGGRWFLDLRSYLYILPFVLLSSILTSGVQSASGIESIQSGYVRYIGLFAANVLSLLICWLYFAAAKSTVFRNRAEKPAPISAVLTFGASLGALKGSTTGLWSWILGIEPLLYEAVFNRVFQTMFLGAWLVPALSLILATLARYRTEREVLIAEKVQLALRNDDNYERDSSRLELQEFVTLAKVELDSIRSSAVDLTSARLVAGKLRSLIDQNLRPLSHKIWERESAKVSDFSLKNLAEVALVSHPFPTVLVGLGFALGFVPVALNVFVAPLAIGYTAINILIISAVFTIGKLIRVSGFQSGIVLFALVVATTATALSFSTDVIFEGLPGYQVGSSLLPIMFWIGQLAIFGSVLAALLANRKQVHGQLVELLGSDGIESAVLAARSQVSNRDFAQYIHGNFQNRLLSSTLHLERAARVQDIQTQISELEELLDNAVEDFISIRDLPLAALLEETSQRWKGFVELVLTIETFDPELPLRLRGEISQLVSEAVSNSVRHGLAKRIEIRIKPSRIPGTVLVVIIDDGLGLRTGVPGLGTALFTELSAGKWAIQSLPEGGVSVELEISPRNSADRARAF